MTEEIEEDIEIIETLIASLEVTDLRDASIAERRATLSKIALNVILLGYSARQPREFNRDRNDRGNYRSGGRDFRGGDRDDRRDRDRDYRKKEESGSRSRSKSNDRKRKHRKRSESKSD